MCRDQLGMTYFCFLSGIDWLENPALLGEKEWDPDAPGAGWGVAPRAEIVTGVAGGDTRFQVFARLYNVVTHVGIDNAELGALLDMNTSGPLPDMSKNRQGELDALTSQRFREALKARNIQLLTYRQVIAMQGLRSMRRPQG